MINFYGFLFIFFVLLDISTDLSKISDSLNSIDKTIEKRLTNG